jgi:hypothetical protein
MAAIEMAEGVVEIAGFPGSNASWASGIAAGGLRVRQRQLMTAWRPPAAYARFSGSSALP